MRQALRPGPRPAPSFRSPLPIPAPRALALFKQLVLRQGHAHDGHNRPIPLGSDDKRGAVEAAKTAWDMYKVIGWVGGGLS